MSGTDASGERDGPVEAGRVVRLGTAGGRWVLGLTALGFLDATAVNVALPSIGRDLDAGVSGLQWVVTGYSLTLTAPLLLGRSFGDRYGRRRVFLAGVGRFTLASRWWPRSAPATPASRRSSPRWSSSASASPLPWLR